MSKKKRKKKRLQSLHRARTVILKNAAIEGLKTADGMIIPALSFDPESIAHAETILMEAGYSGSHANITINNIINQLRLDLEKRLIECEIN